jgi:hypothetical protein
MRIFFAINLNNFYRNRKTAYTRAQIRFVKAQNAKQAKKFIGSHYPKTVWSVLSDSQLERNIVHPQEGRQVR